MHCTYPVRLVTIYADNMTFICFRLTDDEVEHVLSTSHLDLMFYHYTVMQYAHVMHGRSPNTGTMCRHGISDTWLSFNQLGRSGLIPWLVLSSEQTSWRAIGWEKLGDSGTFYPYCSIIFAKLIITVITATLSYFSWYFEVMWFNTNPSHDSLWFRELSIVHTFPFLGFNTNVLLTIGCMIFMRRLTPLYFNNYCSGHWSQVIVRLQAIFSFQFQFRERYSFLLTRL